MLKKIIILSLAVAFISCGNNNSSNKSSTETKTDTTHKADATAAQPTNDLADFEFHTLVINVPSPFDIISDLPKSGMAFNKGLLNTTDNENKYTTSTKRGLNYGAYIVDLVYLSTNEQYSQVKTYFKTTRDIAQNLGCADSFDKIAGNRLEKNIDKKDTINKVIDQIYTEMDSYLRSNDRLLTATQILVGSWIESQYVTVSLIKDETKTKQNEILFQKVSQQGYTLEKLTQLLKEYEKEKDFKTTIKDLNDLATIYKDYKGGDMDKSLLSKIYTKLSEARNNVVK